MSKTMTIAFRHGGKIPASVIGTKEDKKVAAHEAVEVPASYGQSLVDDRFAYKVEVDDKKKPKAKGAEGGDGKAAEIAKLQDAVDAAKLKLDNADMVDKAAAAAELADADAKLAAAKAA